MSASLPTVDENRKIKKEKKKIQNTNHELQITNCKKELKDNQHHFVIKQFIYKHFLHDLLQASIPCFNK